MSTYIGIDINPTSVTTCLTSSTGEIIKSITNHVSKPFNGWQFQDPITTLNAAIHQLDSLSRIDKLKIRSIGISCSSGLIMTWDNDSYVPLSKALPYNSILLELLPPHNLRSSLEDLDKITGNNLLQDLWRPEGQYNESASISNMGTLVTGPIESWLIQVISSSTHPVIDSSVVDSLSSQTNQKLIGQKISDTYPFHPDTFLSLINSIGTITEIDHDELPRLSGVPISAFVSKQGAIMAANNCVMPGSSLLTTDDRWVMYINTGNRPATFSQAAQLSWTNSNSEPVYVCPIPLDSPTKTLSWITDNLKIAKDRIELSEMANQVRSSEHVAIVPHLKTLSTENPRNEFSILLSGIGVSTTQNHLARATFESLSIQISSTITKFTENIGTRPDHLVVDDKSSSLNLLAQLIADQSQIDCKIKSAKQTPTVGAALLSAIGIGDNSFDSLSAEESNTNTFRPSNNRRAAEVKTLRYKNFLEKLGS